MKRLFLLIALCMLLATDVAVAETPAPKALTVMVYMCGSNLETLSGSATADIGEMLGSDFDTDRVNLVVMAGGSRRWDKDLRSGEAGTVEFFRKRGALKKKLLRPESGVNMGDPQTLTDFVRESLRRYPAEEYALILWDHGAGPLEGVCLDELNEPDRISLDGLAQALHEARLPQKLSWIGFDACLMSTLEVANAVAPYADYMIASEETEPATGWDYAFLKGIEADGGSVETARRIIDLYMETPREEGEALTLACTDLSRIDAVVTELDAFFSPISKRIDKKSFAALSNLRVSSMGFGHTVRGVGVDGYDLVDLKDLTRRYAEGNDAGALLDAVTQAVVYQRATQSGVGGLSVYHPYYNKAMFRQDWAERYGRLAYCKGYADYVLNFGAMLDGEALADWRGLYIRDEGFDADNVNLFSVQLTPEQQASFASAQLVVLSPDFGPYIEMWETLDRFSEILDIDFDDFDLSPVYFGNATLNSSGLLTANYTGRMLYATDPDGKPLCGPLAYRLSEDGQTYYLSAEYSNTNGGEDESSYAKVLFNCHLNEDDTLNISRTEVYDPLTDTYSNRVGLSNEAYTRLSFDGLQATPPMSSPMPGFDQWEKLWGSGWGEVGALDPQTPWSLRFFDTQQSGFHVYAAFQITDTQQNNYMSDFVKVKNPNIEEIPLYSLHEDAADPTRRGYLTLDVSPLNTSLNLCVMEEVDFLDAVVINGTRSASFDCFIMDGYSYITISNDNYTNLTDIQRIDLYPAYSDAIALCPEPFDLSRIASTSSAVLAEAELDGVVYQLTRLESAANGTITGNVHVINASFEDKIVSYDTWIINDVALKANMELIKLMPNTDGFISFTCDNSTFIDYHALNLGENLSVKASARGVFLELDNLYDYCASEPVRSIRATDELIMNRLIDKEPLSFEGINELPLNQRQGLARLSDRTLLSLLDGEVSVDLEQTLIADNGIGMRLVFNNHTDRDISISITADSLNGVVRNGYYESDCTYELPAKSRVMDCFAMNTDADDQAFADFSDIRQIALSFSYENNTSLVYIMPREACALGAPYGSYLPGNRLLAFTEDGLNARSNGHADGE